MELKGQFIWVPKIVKPMLFFGAKYALSLDIENYPHIASCHAF